MRGGVAAMMAFAGMARSCEAPLNGIGFANPLFTFCKSARPYKRCHPDRL
jgi:hypothetical protein